MSFVRMTCDRNDPGASKFRSLPKAISKNATIHVGHGEVNEHQIGPKCSCNVERLAPAVGHMNLVAEGFHHQAQRICAISVVIND